MSDYLYYEEQFKRINELADKKLRVQTFFTN